MAAVETRRVLARCHIITADYRYVATAGPEMYATARRRGFLHWDWVLFPDGRFGDIWAEGRARTRESAFLAATVAAQTPGLGQRAEGGAR